MDSKRQQKFSRLLQKELAEVFQRECSHLLHGNYVSVSMVRVSPDLGVAKVYISFLLAKNPQEVMQEIKLHAKTIRHELAQRIKNQVRVIPELHFYLDDSAEYASRMDKIISDLHIPPADTDYKEDAGAQDKEDE